MDKALIIVPEGPDFGRWYRVCLEACERHDLDVAGIIHDGTGHQKEVLRMLLDGQIDRIVVARAEHFPPWIIVATDDRDGPALPPRQRRGRPRLVDRESSTERRDAGDSRRNPGVGDEGVPRG